jgi:large subunit ribosomal protein L17
LALLRNMATSLFRHERITTTVQKAKELRPFAEKLITLAKKGSLHARRQVLRHVKDREVVAKMFETYSARYATRPGGYTRIIRSDFRRGDSAELAIIELVDSSVVLASDKKKTARAKKKAAPKPMPRKPVRKGTARREALADVAAAEETAELAKTEEAEEEELEGEAEADFEDEVDETEDGDEPDEEKPEKPKKGKK